MTKRIRRGSELVQRLFGPTLDRPRASRLDGAGPLAHTRSAMDDEDATAPETLDLRGLKCPLPVLHTRRALGRLAPGRVVVVRCTDPLASLDIPNLVRQTGDALLTAVRDGRETRFAIRKS